MISPEQQRGPSSLPLSFFEQSAGAGVGGPRNDHVGQGADHQSDSAASFNQAIAFAVSLANAQRHQNPIGIGIYNGSGDATDDVNQWLLDNGVALRTSQPPTAQNPTLDSHSQDLARFFQAQLSPAPPSSSLDYLPVSRGGPMLETMGGGGPQSAVTTPVGYYGNPLDTRSETFPTLPAQPIPSQPSSETQMINVIVRSAEEWASRRRQGSESGPLLSSLPATRPNSASTLVAFPNQDEPASPPPRYTFHPDPSAADYLAQLFGTSAPLVLAPISKPGSSRQQEPTPPGSSSTTHRTTVPRILPPLSSLPLPTHATVPAHLGTISASDASVVARMTGGDKFPVYWTGRQANEQPSPSTSNQEDNDEEELSSSEGSSSSEEEESSEDEKPRKRRAKKKAKTTSTYAGPSGKQGGPLPPPKEITQGLGSRSKKSSWICGVEGCGEVFETWSRYREFPHRNLSHLFPIFSFGFDVFFIEFHIRNSHDEAKPFRCGDCGKGFTRAHDLRRHQRCVESIATFACGTLADYRPEHFL